MKSKLVFEQQTSAAQIKANIKIKFVSIQNLNNEEVHVFDRTILS